MEIPRGVKYTAVIVPDEQSGIYARHLHIEPPMSQEAADRLQADERIKNRLKDLRLITLDDGQGRTHFVIPPYVYTPNAEVIHALDEAVQPHGDQVRPLEDLSLEPTYPEYAAFISMRAWKAAA